MGLRMDGYVRGPLVVGTSACIDLARDDERRASSGETHARLDPRHIVRSPKLIGGSREERQTGIRVSHVRDMHPLRQHIGRVYKSSYCLVYITQSHRALMCAKDANLTGTLRATASPNATSDLLQYVHHSS